MNRIFTIINKELKSFFFSPLFFAVTAGTMFVGGVLFFSLVAQFNSTIAQAALRKAAHGEVDHMLSLNSVVIEPYYHSLEVFFIFVIPIFCMRLIAEERKSRTLDLILTFPVSAFEIIFGKFLGAVLVFFIVLLSVFLFPLLLIFITNLEVIPVLVGFLGIVLFSFSCIAIGLFFSTLCFNQATSALLTVVVFTILYSLEIPAAKLNNSVSFFLLYLSPLTHTEMLFRGVLRGQDLIYFLSLISVGIFFSIRSLEQSGIEVI